MKLSKLLISSPLVITPIAMISSLCSCGTNKFEAHAETFIQSHEMFIDVPLTFSYTPKQELYFSLLGDEHDGISIVNDHLWAKNNKATLQLKVADDIWESAAFSFDLNIVYDDLKPAYVIKGFDVYYIFDQPERKDNVRLACAKDQVFPDGVRQCEFLFQFETKTPYSTVITSLDNVFTNDPTYSIIADGQATIQEDSGKFFMKFIIKHDTELPESLDFWATFDMILSFTNSFGNTQTETFSGCTVTHIGIK